jgi:hypothetical protein
MAYFYAEAQQIVTLEKPRCPCDDVSETISPVGSNKK